MNDENKSINNTKRFFIEEISDNQYEEEVSINVEPSEEFAESAPQVEETPAFDYSSLETIDFGSDRNISNKNNSSDEKVIEISGGKIALISVIAVLVIALIVCAVLFLPNLFKPTSGTPDNHWVSGVLDVIPDEYRLGEVISSDKLDTPISGESFFQIGRRVIEKDEAQWGSNLQNFRGKATVTKVEAVEAMQALYPNATRSDIYALLDFASINNNDGNKRYPSYEATDSDSVTYAETIAFMYEILMKYGYLTTGSGPLYAQQQQQPTTPPPSQEPSQAPSATIQPSPSQQPSASTVPGVSAPEIRLSTEALTKDDVIVTVLFPSDATEMKYRLGDLPWADTSSGREIPVSANSTVTISCKINGVEQTLEKTITNIDKVAPIIEQPVYDETPSKSFEVSITVTDDDSEVSLVKFASGKRDAQHFVSQGEIMTAIESVYSFAVTSNGAYTIYAEDAAGNATVHVMNVTNIDTTAPVIRVDENNEGWINRSNTIYVTITDENLASAYYIIDGQASQEITIVDGKVDRFPIAIDKQGSFNITIIAADKADNQRPQTEHIKIDYTDPSKPTVAEVLASGSDVKFKLSEATDAHSGVKEVIVESGDNILTPDADGYYTVIAGTLVSVTVEDNAGNKSFTSYPINVQP